MDPIMFVLCVLILLTIVAVNVSCDYWEYRKYELKMLGEHPELFEPMEKKDVSEL